MRGPVCERCGGDAGYSGGGSSYNRRACAVCDGTIYDEWMARWRWSPKPSVALHILASMNISVASSRNFPDAFLRSINGIGKRTLVRLREVCGPYAPPGDAPPPPPPARRPHLPTAERLLLAVARVVGAWAIQAGSPNTLREANERLRVSGHDLAVIVSEILGDDGEDDQ